MEKLLVPRLWLDGWMEVEQGPARDRDKKNQFDDDSFGTQPASKQKQRRKRAREASQERVSRRRRRRWDGGVPAAAAAASYNKNGARVVMN